MAGRKNRAIASGRKISIVLKKEAMKFHFSRHRLRKKEKALERFFEILPGFTSWTILIGMALLSFMKPLTAAVIIIAFDLYWLLRLLYVNIFLACSYGKLAVEKKTDWMMRARGIDRLEEYLDEVSSVASKSDFKGTISSRGHRGELRNLQNSGKAAPLLDDIHHLVIIPVASESREIVEPGVESIIRGEFPPERILVIMAVEDRATEDIKKGIVEIQEKYQDKFLDLQIAIHPSGLSGEARVKGANATYAAKQAAEYFRKKNIPFENVVSSCFDADTVVHPDYFSCLTYHYMVCPERLRASFQPIPVYHNNIWKVPGFARLLDVGSSFFLLMEVTNPEKLVTFSSHSMSFKALVDVDYWPVDMISDDSAIFWKAFIHFNSDYRVVPMYVTLSMDVTEAATWGKTIVNVYKQKRRWAWGVENFPIVMRAFLKSRDIPFFKKLKYGYKLFDGHITWTTWPFLLTIISWLPAVFASREFSQSVVYYSAPRITGTIFSLASLGLINCILLSMLLLPKRKVKHNLIKRVKHAFEWLLIPPIGLFLSALPALDAQTRLMFAKYMEFWVTTKERK